MTSGSPQLVSEYPAERRTKILLKGGEAMRTYERPTLNKAGSFKKVTGIGGSGPRDLFFRHQSV
jgi:hypothetical protein